MGHHNSEIRKKNHFKFYRLSDVTFYDCINTIYQFTKPFLDNKMPIFEEYGAFNVSASLTHKVPKLVADDVLIFYLSEKINFNISCEMSAWLAVHMKCQHLYTLKKKQKQTKNKKFQKVVCCSLIGLSCQFYQIIQEYHGTEHQ